MKRIFILLLVFIASNTLFAQSVKMEGVITGDIENVRVSSTSNPTESQKINNGHFTISIRGTGDTLVFEAPGYERQLIGVDAATPMPLQVNLIASGKALDEVIVNTGYQRLPKERATGSFTTIDNKLLNEQVGTTVLDKLESIANGLYVDRQTTTGGRPRIIIRGVSTINGPASPLIVLDDFPYEGDLNNINPNDVENITILKDAAAASIWGTRAGNGVIVITTKRGRYNQPMKVEFISNATSTYKPSLNSIKDISTTDFIGVEQYLYNKGYYTGQLTGTPWKAVSPVVELFYQRDQGNLSPQEVQQRLTEIGKYRLTDELLNHVYKKGVNLQQSISLSGGSKNMSWSILGGWDHNSDQLSNKYDRYNIKSSQTFRLTPKLELNTSLDYTQTQTVSGKQGYGLATNTGFLPVYTRLKADDGTALPVNLDYRQVYADSAGGGKLLDWSYYPLTDADHIHNKGLQQAVLTNIGLSYKLIKDLSIAIKYGYGRQVSTGQELDDEGSYATRNAINTFTAIDAGGNVTYNLPRGNLIYNSNGIIETQNFRAQATYNKAWGNHEISAIAGTEWRQRKYDYNSSSNVGYDPDILSSSPRVDALHPYPNFLSGADEYMPVGKNYSGTVNVNISFFGNASYTYARKYTISASARRDASNLFGASKNNRWTPLYSAGLAWDISKENFYRVTWLPGMKLRATYGISGNADPLRSATTILRSQFVSQFTGLSISQIAQYGNKNLGWERVAMMNIGVDLTSRNNRISGSVEYYHKRGSKLFGYANVDYTAISTNIVEKNVADIKGHGWDIGINSKNITGRFYWNTQLNVNLNKDKVVHYYLPDQIGASFLGGGISGIEGDPVYGLYGYQWAGLDPLTGDPQGYLDGVISKDYAGIAGSSTTIRDLKYSGPVLPTRVLSIGNTIGFKRLSLSIRITGKFGNYFQRSSINYSDLFRRRSGHSDFALRWQQPGDEKNTQVPSMTYPIDDARASFYAYSSVLATKADFIRLQYINLAYDFKKVQVYINANNLGLIWKANKYDIDPEYNGIGYPAATNIAVGLKADF